MSNITWANKNSGDQVSAADMNEIKSAVNSKVDTNGTDRLMTAAEATKLANTSGTNSGDETSTTILNKIGNGTVIDPSHIPAIAIVEFLGNSANQTEMLAKVGQKGDWIIRTDQNKVYVITGADPTVLGNWTPLAYPADTITSVNGQTGVVSLNATHINLSGSYVKASSAAAIASGDSIEVGLGKLEYKIDSLGNSNVITLTDGAVVEWDLSDGNIAELELTANALLDISGTASWGILYLTKTAANIFLSLPGVLQSNFQESIAAGDLDVLYFKTIGGTMYWGIDNFGTLLDNGVSYATLTSKVFEDLTGWSTFATSGNTAEISNANGGVNKAHVKSVANDTSANIYKANVYVPGDTLKVTISGVVIISGVVNLRIGNDANTQFFQLSAGDNVLIIDTGSNTDSYVTLSAGLVAPSEGYIRSIKVEKQTS